MISEKVDLTIGDRAYWSGRLSVLRQSIEADPLANPIRQLGYELSVSLESEEITLDTLERFISELMKDGLDKRATALSAQLGFDRSDGCIKNAELCIDTVSPPVENATDFIAYWQVLRDVVVFTGHPTFLLSEAQRAYIASEITGRRRDHPDTDLCPPARSGVTLDHEHQQVLVALKAASTSISAVNSALVKKAQKLTDDSYRRFVPGPVRLGSWVGYDMDGRSDIGWASIIKHRLLEKKIRLSFYLERVRALNIDHNDLETLDAILERNILYLDDILPLFGNDLTSTDHISRLANKITGFKGNITRASMLVSILDKVIADTDKISCEPLLALRADIACFNLGLGEVHFRLNSAQIRNAARHALDLDRDEDLFGKSALDAVQDLIRTTKPVEVNFGSLAIEQTTAIRLFIAIAQIIKHIDTEQPVRLLIAECENPVTVLSCIYLAKRFGVAESVDICPLFETAFALDRSRRILDVLFRQETYREYVYGRGRIAIQSGFSDAGRFMGQIPASLAIERLQGHFAQLIEIHGLSGLAAIIFNTHGESLGRGHHQASLEDRGLYALSPWARMQFEKRGIHLISETSYQGGDGFLLFDDQKISDSIVATLIEAWHQARALKPEEDEFYLDTSTSLDFYRNVKSSQSNLYAQPAYQGTVTALGLAMLPVTGSRVVRRQNDRRKLADKSLRQVRAIPHNASLQQIGVLANLFGGVGAALSKDRARFIELARHSDRFNRIMRLVALANARSDIKILIAYMKLFDGSLWATRPITGREHGLESACAILGNQLAGDGRYFSALKLAAILRSDSIVLTRMIKDMGLEVENADPPGLHMLHAIRIAIIQHVFLLGARLPKFSVFAGQSRDDILDMLFKLEIEQACDILAEVFPAESPDLSRFSINEQANYPQDNMPHYQSIHEAFIEPLLECNRLILLISNAVCHHHRAFG